MSPYPGEPWNEFLNRAYHVAATAGVVVILGVSYTAADVRKMIEADDASPAPVVRLSGLGGAVPTAALPVQYVQTNQAGATGAAGEPGPIGEDGVARLQDLTGATGVDGASGANGANGATGPERRSDRTDEDGPVGPPGPPGPRKK